MGILRNVLYVPQLARNLVSVKQLTDDGYEIIFQGKSVVLEDRIGQSTIGGLYSNLYLLNENASSLHSTSECDNPMNDRNIA